MKAKIKATGEIVDILRFGYSGTYTVYIDSKGNEHDVPMNYHRDFEEIEEPKEIDWEQRRYEIAKDVIASCLAYGSKKIAAEQAIEIADELIKHLKGRIQ